MKIDYSGSLTKSLAFCIQPKRWLPFFVIDLAFVSVALTAVLANMPYFIYIMSGVEDLSAIAPVMNLIFSVVLLFTGWILLNIWISGSLIHQSHKEKEFGQSWGVAGKRYFSLLGVSAVTAIGAMIVGMIPFIGFIMSILVGLLFFFGMQSVIVKGNGFVSALEDSVALFRKYPFKVFLIWLAVAVISMLILLVFSLPILALLFNMFTGIPELTAGGDITTPVLMNLIFAVQNQMPLLVLTGAILLIGFGVSRTFALKAQTEFYSQFKKK
jgi:hypothetical protein